MADILKIAADKKATISPKARSWSEITKHYNIKKDNKKINKEEYTKEAFIKRLYKNSKPPQII